MDFKQNDVIALQTRFEQYSEGTVVVVLRKHGQRALQVEFRQAGLSVVNRVIPVVFFRQATVFETLAHLQRIFVSNSVMAIHLAYANECPVQLASFLAASNLSSVVNDAIPVIVQGIFDGKISREMADDFLSAFSKEDTLQKDEGKK